MHRFYLPDLRQPVLTAEEAHHCRHVLRLKSGDEVEVFDGRGHAAAARIAQLGTDSVRLEVLRPRDTSALPCRITLAQAIPKKNMDIIVQKATELGVAHIVPLLSERTVVQLDGASKKLDRWREIALESCKQCSNNWLPEIHAPQKPHDFLAAPGTYDLKLIASLQPGSQSLKSILGTSALSHLGAVLVLVGPEGDFTPAEYAAAQAAGCRPLSLGPLVLRADTAALYTLSILHHELQVR